MDVISDISFGQPIGYLANDADMYNYIQMIETQLPFIAITTVHPWLVDVMSSRIFKGLVPLYKDALGFRKLMG